MNSKLMAYEIKNARILVGGTIRGVIATDGDDSFGLQVQLPDGPVFKVWIDRDPEGNGPGHLSIERE